MYREAAKALGIDCSLSSTCRCIECQSRYFDYDESTTEPTTDSGETDYDEDSCCSDTDSELNDDDRFITNCYLIHSEELCESCQMQNNSDPHPNPFNDIACNELSFNNFYMP